MNDEVHDSRGGSWRPASRFLKDMVSFAGSKGILAAGLVGLGALLEGIGLVLVIPLLGIVTDTASVGWMQQVANVLFGLFAVESRFARLVLILGMLILLMLIRAATISARDVTVARLEIGFSQALQSRIVSALGSAGWERVSRLRHARISHLMSGEIRRIGTGAHVFLRGAIAVVMLACQCVVAFALSPLLASLSFLLLAASAAALMPLLKRARELGAIMTDTNLLLMNSAAQFLGGLKLAVSHDLQSSFVSEFNSTLQGFGRREVDFIRQYTNNRLAVTTLGAMIGAIAVLVGFAILGAAPPVLLTLLLILSRMSGPATTAQGCAQEFVRQLPAYERVKLLEEELQGGSEIGTKEAPIVIPEGPIVFRDVGFQHVSQEGAETGEQHLQRINLTITPGSFIGITGPSGAGKTTFADLLVGLFAPSSGEIFIGTTPLRGPAVAGWRRQISYVSQDQFLFHDTIRRNLLWANPLATESDFQLALETAGADAFVHRLPQGLDTVVGERGTLVSGGERQRIAMARALVRKPRLLVLDEATNAIDVAGERSIVERLLKLRPRMTVMMIAHRSESLSLCDQVLTFESGRLVSERSFVSHEAHLTAVRKIP